MPYRLVRRYFQDAKGRLALHPKGTDTRWKTHGSKAILGYKQHVLVDDNGYILAQEVTDAAGAETRRELERRNIEAHVPPHTRHLENRRTTPRMNRRARKFLTEGGNPSKLVPVGLWSRMGSAPRRVKEGLN